MTSNLTKKLREENQFINCLLGKKIGTIGEIYTYKKFYKILSSSSLYWAFSQLFFLNILKQRFDNLQVLSEDSVLLSLYFHTLLARRRGISIFPPTAEQNKLISIVSKPIGLVFVYCALCCLKLPYIALRLKEEFWLGGVGVMQTNNHVKPNFRWFVGSLVLFIFFCCCFDNFWSNVNTISTIRLG